MAENRCSCSERTASSCGREAVVIDTMHVLDSCRDRDCYEDVRAYLTPEGRELINRTATVRTVEAKIVGTAISVDEVPFNCGFYQISIRFYIRLRNEACVGAGATREFYSLLVAQKSAVLYGGEGSTTVFRSAETGGFCCTECTTEGISGAPVAVVEAAAPVVLSTRVVCCDANGGGTGNGCSCCSCDCQCSTCDVSESIPDAIADLFDGDLALSGEDGNNRFLISIGIFSVIRLERPAQYLISGATEYSVPDKECRPAESRENPCCLFRTMAFPIGAFGQSSAGEGKHSH